MASYSICICIFLRASIRFRCISISGDTPLPADEADAVGVVEVVDAVGVVDAEASVPLSKLPLLPKDDRNTLFFSPENDFLTPNDVGLAVRALARPP